MKSLDKSRKEIKVGDFIIYGHALGRCAGLRYGKVLAIKEVKDYADRIKNHFTVQGVDDDWYPDTPKLAERKGTLQFGDRILIVTEDQIPDKIFELLNGVEVD